MNWKEKLADWLTGGVLTALDEDAEKWHKEAILQMEKRGDCIEALHDIIAMRTENCAHIGKRMAARAEEVVGAR